MPPFAVALTFRTSSDAAVLKGVCSVPVATQRSSLLSDPQLLSCTANTHLNLSRWSPHQAGGLIISSAECSRGHVSALSRSHHRHHHFCFFRGVGVAAASVYFNVTRRTDAGRSCTDVRSDEHLEGRRVGLFNLAAGF